MKGEQSKFRRSFSYQSLAREGDVEIQDMVNGRHWLIRFLECP